LQFFLRPLQAREHRADRYAEKLGRLLCRIPLDEPKRHDDPELRLKGIERAGDDFLPVELIGNFVRSGFFRFVLDIGGAEEQPAPLPAAELIKRKVNGDPGHIGTYRRLLPEALQGVVEPDESLLPDVVRLVSRPNHPDHGRRDLRFVSPDKLAEGGEVSLAGTPQKLSVGGFFQILDQRY